MRKLLTSVALLTLTVALAAPAMAVSWGPNSTYYKGIKRATGSGSFTNVSNTYARNRMTVQDNSNDGNTVYGVSITSFYQWECNVAGQCGTIWTSSRRASTPEFSNATRSFTLDRTLSQTGSRARAQTFACAQMGWPVPDSCATASYPTFSY